MVERMMSGTWRVAAMATAVVITAQVFMVPRAAQHSDEERAIAAVLDDFHDAASKADGARYFAHLSEDAVFLGTDADERWTKQEFHEYCAPHFEQGRGWTYITTRRVISVDSSGTFGWFDELLHSEKYGQCRGSGVMVKRDSRWRIAQYNLSLPVPNELALGVVEMVRGDAFQPTTVFVVRHAERADDGTQRDPALSEPGRARAQHLQRMLGGVELTAIYSTPYQRTRQTVGPTAAAHDITVGAYTAIPELVQRIRVEHAGGRVLVAGHSNTVGVILAALGCDDPPTLGEGDYGDLFIVTLDAAGRAGLMHLRMD